MNESSKTVVRSIKNSAFKHRGKILVTTNIATLAVALAFKTNVAKHNEFLKEHDLFDAFYATFTPEA